MKYTFSILLLGFFFFLLPTKHEKVLEETVEGQCVTSIEFLRTPVVPVNSWVGGNTDRNPTSSVEVEVNNAADSFQDRCVRGCVMPLVYRCIGLIFWCNKRSCCRRTS